ncbi:MAG TPA: hypothetical protein VF092_00560 [Longimicrobium sp.]
MLKHQQEIARLQQQKARESSSAASETAKSNSASEAARRASSASTLQSKLREAQKHTEAATRFQKKVAELETKIAREQARLHDAQKRLDAEEVREARQRAQKQERTSQEQERRMKAFSTKLTQHEKLHAVALNAIAKLENPPEKITVLFLASNPVDQKQLRLDEEVRAIGEMVRKSEHRDAVDLQSRWAVRPLDVLQAINECKPTIVHFSGHGSNEDEIVFQDNAGHARVVSKEAIVQTMAAGSDDIQLVFFNTCYSRGQAEAVVEHVPAAIGMNTSVGDVAARIFSAQFYSALGFGLSIGLAFRQAKAALMLENIPEESTPELFVMKGLDAEQLVLVKPVERAFRSSTPPAA